MSKFSTRFLVVSLTFVIGIFAVVGWFYYQKSHKNSINNFRTLAKIEILFEGINNATNLGNLPELRKTFLGSDDIEIRIWRGFGLSSLEGIVLKRADGQWSGLHIKSNNYHEPVGVKVEKLIAPKSGWESFWKQLTDKEILTLPQSFENECNIPDIDGIGYVVEINQNRNLS